MCAPSSSCSAPGDVTPGDVTSDCDVVRVGDVKLLRHKTTRKVRVLMRREQVLRTCLNHYVSAETQLREMAGSKGCAVTWQAQDFSEGEQRHENLSLRFKTPEISEHFRQVFDIVKQGKDLPPELRSAAPNDVPASSPVALNKKSPIKSQSAKPAEKSASGASATADTPVFTFKMPDATPSSSASSFSSLKFSAPTFGSGVSSSPFVFSAQTPTKNSQPPATQDTPTKPSALASAVSTNLFGAGASASVTSDTADDAQSPSLLRALLIDNTASAQGQFEL